MVAAFAGHLGHLSMVPLLDLVLAADVLLATATESVVEPRAGVDIEVMEGVAVV